MAYPSNEQWKEGIRRGDENAYLSIYPLIYGVISRRIWDQTDAEDIAQETITAVYKNIESYDPKRTIKAWVATIAKNKTIDFFRNKINVDYLDSLEELLADQNAEDPADCLDEPRITEKIIEAAHLTEKLRDIVDLRFVRHVSREGMSNSYGIKKGTVASRENRAREIIREVINEKEEAA